MSFSLQTYGTQTIFHLIDDNKFDSSRRKARTHAIGDGRGRRRFASEEQRKKIEESVFSRRR